MVNWVLPNALEGLADGTVDYDTDTIKLALIDLGTADAGIKAITSTTNATPVVVTCTGHGFADGDIVVIQGVATGTVANNIWKIANQATNTFELVSVIDGTTNSVGNGVGSGGVAVCLGPSGAGDHWDDFSAALVGTAVTLGSKTATDGVLDAADPTFTSVPGTTSVEALMSFEDTGTPSTSRMLSFHDGYHLVVCNTTAAASATSMAVEPLEQDIASGATLVFSNGASATLSGAASAGARSISVTSLAAQITAGSYASAPVTSSGLPVTTNGGNIGITLDANGLVTLRRY